MGGSFGGTDAASRGINFSVSFRLFLGGKRMVTRLLWPPPPPPPLSTSQFCAFSRWCRRVVFVFSSRCRCCFDIGIFSLSSSHPALAGPKRFAVLFLEQCLFFFTSRSQLSVFTDLTQLWGLLLCRARTGNAQAMSVEWTSRRIATILGTLAVEGSFFGEILPILFLFWTKQNNSRGKYQFRCL